MISTHVVKLATEYLDQCAAENQQATLVGMHWYIDGRDKTLPLLEEVNEALMQRASVYVQRVNGAVVFSSIGSERVVTVEDMKRADKQYRKEFAVALKKLGK
jgi:hypothetical protein